MVRFRSRNKRAGFSLAALGIVERSADKAHASLVAAGWTEIGYGYHGSVHAHPDHPDVIVRLARKANGFGDYAALLRKGFAGSDGPHVPRVHDLSVSRCGASMTVGSRLTDPRSETWWLAYEPFVDHPSFDGIHEDFRASWPGYEAYVATLRAVSPRALDPNVGNVLVGQDGSPVVNDPLCDDGYGLWRSPLSRLTARIANALRRLADGISARGPATA